MPAAKNVSGGSRRGHFRFNGIPLWLVDAFFLFVAAQKMFSLPRFLC
jgi:hypothetical protein